MSLDFNKASKQINDEWKKKQQAIPQRIVYNPVKNETAVKTVPANRVSTPQFVSTEKGNRQIGETIQPSGVQVPKVSNPQAGANILTNQIANNLKNLTENNTAINRNDAVNRNLFTKDETGKNKLEKAAEDRQYAEQHTVLGLGKDKKSIIPQALAAGNWSASNALINAPRVIGDVFESLNNKFVSPNVKTENPNAFTAIPSGESIKAARSDYETIRNYYGQHAQEAQDTLMRMTANSQAQQQIANLVQSVPEMAAIAAVSYMSGGTAGAALGADMIGGTLATGAVDNTISGMIGRIIKQYANNPAFWSSMATQAAHVSEEAKAAGADPFTALTATALIGPLNAAIETAGGIGSGEDDLLKILTKGQLGKATLNTALEEGLEEVKQGGVQELVFQALGINPVKPFTNELERKLGIPQNGINAYASTEAYDAANETPAVIDPSRMAQEFAGGALMGGLMSLPGHAVNYQINKVDSQPVNVAEQMQQENVNTQQQSIEGETQYTTVNASGTDSNPFDVTSETISRSDSRYDTREKRIAAGVTTEKVENYHDRMAKAYNLNYVYSVDPNENGHIEGNTIYFNPEKKHLSGPHAGEYKTVSGFTFDHEISHFFEGTKEYKSYEDFVESHLSDLGYNYENELQKIKPFYENNPAYLKLDEEGQREYLRQELTADFGQFIFADEKFADRIARENPTLFDKLRNFIDDFLNIAKATATGDKELLFLTQARRNFEKAARKVQAENRYNENLKKYSVDSIAESMGLTVRKNENGFIEYYDTDGNRVEEVSTEYIRTSPVGQLLTRAAGRGSITREQAEDSMKLYAQLSQQMQNTQDPDFIWAINSTIGFNPMPTGPRTEDSFNRNRNRFSAFTGNSDPQYKSTIDMTTICTRTQAIVDAMSGVMMEEGRGLTEDEIINIVYKRVFEAGEPVPCPVCYVFSRWVGLGGLFDKMKKFQEKYDSMDTRQLQSTYRQLERQIDQYIQDNSTASNKVTGTDARNKIDKKIRKEYDELKRAELMAAVTGVKLTPAEETRMKELGDQLDILDAWSYLGRVRLNPDYEKEGKVPDSILFNMNDAINFAEKYPLAWGFRTTRGPSMGKAAAPYTDVRLGQIVQGISGKDVSKLGNVNGSRNNGFVNLTAKGEMGKGAQDQLTKAIQRAKVQNLLNGQRLQSTSDTRPEYALDYLMAYTELMAVKSKAQLYTKVGELVRMHASMGAEVNCSLMPKGSGIKGDGSLDFSDVTGMDARDAFYLSGQYDNVQPIMVGIGHEHIRLCMADNRISFIIPFHASGSSESRYKWMMDIVNESVEGRTDFAEYESEHDNPNATPLMNAAYDLRMKILTGKAQTLSTDEIAILENPTYEPLKQLYLRFYGYNQYGETEKISDKYIRPSQRGKNEYTDDDTLNVFLPKAQAEVIMPYEYWDMTLNLDRADENGRAYMDYVRSLGMTPVFSGVTRTGTYKAEGDFTAYPGYWKTLIDRRMYNRDGTYHEQMPVSIDNFDLELLNPVNGAEGLQGKMQENHRDKTAEIVRRARQDLRDREIKQSAGEGAFQDTPYNNNTDSEGRELSEQQKQYFGQSKVRDENGNLMVMYHGTEDSGFKVFDPDISSDGLSMFFTSDKEIARSYAGNSDIYAPSVNDYNSPETAKEYILDHTDHEVEIFVNDRGNYQIDDEDGYAVDQPNLADAVDEYIEDYLDMGGGAAIYGTYLDIKNPLIIDAEGKQWDELPNVIDENGEAMTTNQYARYAYDNGYDGVIFKNIFDTGIYGGVAQKDTYATNAVVFSSNQIKSINNINPTENPDIRYSVREGLTARNKQEESLLNRLWKKAGGEGTYAKSDETPEPAYLNAAPGQARAMHEKQAKQILENSDRWKDKRGGLRFSIETAERNIEDIAGTEEGRIINDTYFKPVHRNEAGSTRMKNDYREAVRELNISEKKKYDTTKFTDVESDNIRSLMEAKEKVSESALVQMFGEGLISTKNLEEVGADVEKIQTAAGTMRAMYEQMLEAANEILVSYGYKPIAHRENYFPHFTEDTPDTVLAKIGNRLGFRVQKDELPTDIAGLTHTFKPGKKWFGNALERKGTATEYDALEGFDRYIEGIGDVIFHTEDIQKLRALERELRYKYSSKGQQERLDAINNDSSLSEIEKEVKRQEIYDAGMTKHSTFAQWIRRYTDTLAGKKSQTDRNVEYLAGRKTYGVVKALESRVAANMVALNPGSWLTNFIPLVQGSEVKNSNIIKGMAGAVQALFSDDGFADESAFLTNRAGSNPLTSTGVEKIVDALTRPMEWIDQFTSQSLVRAKYLQNIENGMETQEAMDDADRFAANVIADRSKGALPLAFEAKNPLVKILTMYQVEVSNQWNHLFKDIPRTEKNVAKVALAYTKFAVGAYIFNDVFEKIVGRRPALDPISWLNDMSGDVLGKKVPNFIDAVAAMLDSDNDDEDDENGAQRLNNLMNTETVPGGNAITNLASNVAEDLPFIGGLLGGGRVPIQSALPDVKTIATDWANVASGDLPRNKAVADTAKELSNPLVYLVPPVGGGQAKKVYQSARDILQGGNYSIDKQGNRTLRYAVDNDYENWIKGLLFGQYALKGGPEYIKNGFNGLNADRTRIYEALTESGMKNSDADKLLKNMPAKKDEIAEYLFNSDITEEHKNLVYSMIDKREEKAVKNYLKNSGMDEEDTDAFITALPENKAEWKSAISNSGQLSYKQKGELNEKLDKAMNSKLDFATKSTLEFSMLNDSQQDYVNALTSAGLKLPEALKGNEEIRNADVSQSKAVKFVEAGLSVEEAISAAQEIERNGLSQDKIFKFMNNGLTYKQAADATRSLGDYGAGYIQAAVLMNKDYYTEDLCRALGISDSAIERAQVVHDNGITVSSVNRRYKAANLDGKNNVTYKEAKEYLSGQNMAASEKAVWFKILTNAPDKSNPYL